MTRPLVQSASTTSHASTLHRFVCCQDKQVPLLQYHRHAQKSTFNTAAHIYFLHSIYVHGTVCAVSCCQAESSFNSIYSPRYVGQPDVRIQAKQLSATNRLCGCVYISSTAMEAENRFPTCMHCQNLACMQDKLLPLSTGNINNPSVAFLPELAILQATVGMSFDAMKLLRQ